MPVQLDNSNAGVVTLTQNATFTATRTYTFPTAQGANNELLRSDGAGVLTWSANNGLGTAMASSLLTTGAGATNNVSILNPFAAPTGSASMSLAFSVFSTPTTGFNFQAQVTDGTATGGNARGQPTIDFQKQRTAATQVAASANGVIFGGANNGVIASFGALSVMGGYGNTIGDFYSSSVIMGGSGNTMSGATASSSSNVILGGSGNTINLATGTTITGAAILGGLNNVASGNGTIVLGGYAGQGRGYVNALIWPTANALALSSANSLCQTVTMTTIQEGASIAVSPTTSNQSTTMTLYNCVASSNNSTNFITGIVLSFDLAADTSRAYTYDSLIRKAATAASITLIGGSVVTTIVGTLVNGAPSRNTNTTVGSATIDQNRTVAAAVITMNFMFAHEVTY